MRAQGYNKDPRRVTPGYQGGKLWQVWFVGPPVLVAAPSAEAAIIAAAPEYAEDWRDPRYHAEAEARQV